MNDKDDYEFNAAVTADNDQFVAKWSEGRTVTLSANQLMLIMTMAKIGVWNIFERVKSNDPACTSDDAATKIVNDERIRSVIGVASSPSDEDREVDALLRVIALMKHIEDTRLGGAAT